MAELENKVYLPEDDDSETLTLTDEDGLDVTFEIIACIEYEGAEYALMVPTVPIDGAGTDEAVIFRVEDDENDPDYVNYIPLTDEETMDAVFAEYLRIVEEAGD